MSGVCLCFAQPQRCLSSAVVNGGLVYSRGFLNMHLRHDRPLGSAGPQARLNAELAARHLPADSVGMMTGASMRSLRLASVQLEDHQILLLLTSGLSNARRAGDHADQRSLADELSATGTINMALVSTLALTPAAMAETLATLTEAKAAALQDLAVTSPVSGQIATGTGTDATAVFCASDGVGLRYTGKHTRFGEVAARLVIDALRDSLAPRGALTDAG